MAKMGKKVFAALFLCLLALAGYFYPPLAIFPVAAAFYLLPGAALASAFGKGLSKLEWLCVSIILSFLVSAHAAYWLSLAFGYSRETLVALAALFSFTAVFVKIPGEELKKENSVKGIVKIGKNNFVNNFDSSEKSSLPERILRGKSLSAALAITIVFLIVLLGMYHNNFWSERNGNIIVGGWNWSDLFVHLPIALSINNGNFPPQMPFYAGEKLVYHYFVDFHSALASKLLGGELAQVIETMRLENSLLPPLFFLLCFLLTRRISGKNSTALVAAVIIVFGGGFTYYNLFQKSLEGNSLLELARTQPFDNDGKFFQIPSTLGGFLLVQRPQMVGLPALAAVLLLLVLARGEKNRGNWLLAGLAAGLLAPFQYFAFATAVFAIAAFLFCGFLEQRKEEQAKGQKDKSKLEKNKNFFASQEYATAASNAFAALAPCVFSLPFALEAFSTTSGAGHVKQTLGWLAPKEPLAFAAFYFANLGIPLVLGVAAIFLAKSKRKKELVLIGAFCFILPNIVALSGTVWDMGKFFTYLLIPAGILAATLLEKIWQGNRMYKKMVVASALALSVVTPLQMVWWTGSSDWVAFDAGHLQAGEWIGANTPEKSVFVTSTTHISPVDAVGGRLRVVGYAGWMNNFGLPYQEREALLEKAFCGSASEKRRAISELGAEYVFSGSEEKRVFPCEHSKGLQKLFDNGETQVYKAA